MSDFITIVLHGLTWGALIALVAVGYTMVYGIIKLINFAHGEFYMTGGFAGMLALLLLCSPGGALEHLPGGAKLLLGLVAAGLAVAALAVLTERIAYRPIRGSGRIAALLTAVGVSLLLQNAAIGVFGSKQTSFPATLDDLHLPRWHVNLDDLREGEVSAYQVSYRAPIRNWKGEVALDAQGKQLGYRNVNLVDAGKPIEKKRLDDARKAKPEELLAYPSITVSLKQIVIFVTLALTALGLYVLVQRTRMGRAMRAVSHDFEAASLMGIATNKIVSFTFFIGGGLAGLGGVLAGGMFIGTVDPMMGFLFGLKAFIAAVLGGIGSIPGALLGGLALGLVEQLAQYYADGLIFKGASAYRDAIAFLILIGVLLLRPSGFFGRFEGEKV
ncbi:MAG: branched-chain amino acid ABC transporter permease [Planctomycetes bacterium]|nr:branched-chain amino acid ABC transporter permease [Planctomycetota bacterium]